jgi:L-rhamnose mutarotase
VESEEKWNLISETEECQKWWEYMSNLMKTNSDNSPVSEELQEVFYLA